VVGGVCRLHQGRHRQMEEGDHRRKNPADLTRAAAGKGIARLPAGRSQGKTPMNQLDLQGRHAVVTGGASGIGFAIAERLAASGAAVAIWDLDETSGRAAAAKLSGTFTVADVRDPASVARAVAATVAVVPAIDILINNAGITGPNVTLWDYPVDA